MINASLIEIKQQQKYNNQKKKTSNYSVLLHFGYIVNINYDRKLVFFALCISQLTSVYLRVQFPSQKTPAIDRFTHSHSHNNTVEHTIAEFKSHCSSLLT